MKKEKYIEDIKEIKNIMNRSTRFISLSGLSGVSTGIIALIGVISAYEIVFKDQTYLVYNAIELNNDLIKGLLFIAGVTLLLSIGSAIFFTNRNTKKQQQKVWNEQSKSMLYNLLIPLIAGGLLCLMLLSKGFVGMLLPITLIFYGIALVNASKYTFSEIKSLGIIEIILGLAAFQFIEYGLYFWALGFGFFQIIYGLIVQIKYKP